jgi:Recombination directionality factor-like
MTGFAQRVTTIKGLSDKRRLPRLGVVRLGIKKKSAKGAEYPAEVDYFVVPDEVKKVYGEKPTELDVMIPLNELEAVFPCAYKHYGSSKGLKCTGDGEKAWRVNEESKEMEEITCPCPLLEQKKCNQSGTLNVILQKINVGGVYQIRTGSFHSIIDINSGIDYVKALVGRVAMVPLKLRRDKTETHHDDKKQFHYTLKLILDANIDTINMLRTDNIRILEYASHIALPTPKDDNPELDPPDVLDAEEPQEEVKESTKGKKTLLKQYDRGMAVMCPDLKKIRPKEDCDCCETTKDKCIAWE